MLNFINNVISFLCAHPFYLFFLSTSFITFLFMSYKKNSLSNSQDQTKNRIYIFIVSAIILFGVGFFNIDTIKGYISDVSVKSLEKRKSKT